MTDSIQRGDGRLRELRAKLDRISRDFGNPSDGGTPTAEARRAVRKHMPRAERTRNRVEPVIYRRDLPRHEPQAPAVTGSGNISLDDAVDGTEAVHPSRGTCCLIRSEVDGGPSIQDRLAEQLAADSSYLHERLAATGAACPPDLEGMMFVDLETTGLGNSPVFLIGTMVYESGSFEVRQYFARNYAEEPAILASFLDACTSKRLLVTFNGKSFDLPYVRTRAVANGVPFTVDLPHFDLLHECRRVWKETLPDCRLQTLEHHVCGRPRHEDIPSAEVPQAYHDFVRTENASRIVGVLNHNLLDLVTLADLMAHFP